MPADRDRAHLGRADRLRRLRVADRDEPERRRRDRAPRPEPARRSRRSGPGRPRRSARTAIEPDFVPRVSSQDGLLAEFPRPEGRVLFAAAENSRRGPDRRARGRLRPALPHAAARARAAGRATSSSSPRARRRARTRGSAAPAGGSIGPETTQVARSVGLTVVARGGDARPRRARRGGRRVARGDWPSSLMYASSRSSRDFGLQDDFVGRLPRRDQADRARRPDRRHHPRDRGRRRSRRARSCSPARCRTCRWPSTSRSSIPASAATAAPSRSGPKDGRIYVGPDNGLLTLAAPTRARSSPCAR